MKKIIRKAFWDFENEEKWLNSLSLKGLAMTDYNWCRYVFETDEPGKYIYRIELLKDSVTHPESERYIDFVEETGAEFVASYMKWIYFRKKASEGEFEIYTDTDSKIAHYKKISRYWNFFAGIEIGAGILNIALSLIYFFLEGDLSTNFFLGIPFLGLGTIFLKVGNQARKMIKRLQKEKKVLE